MRTFSSDKTCLSGELALGAVRTTVFSDGSTPVRLWLQAEADRDAIPILDTLTVYRDLTGWSRRGFSVPTVGAVAHVQFLSLIG